MNATDELIEQCKAVMTRSEYDVHYGYHPDDELTDIEYLQYLQDEQTRLDELFNVAGVDKEKYWKWRRETVEKFGRHAAWPAEPRVKIE